MNRLVILGAGTGGTIVANKARRLLKESEWKITIIDKRKKHIFQPGLIFIPFKLYGYTGEAGNVRDTQEFIPEGVDFINAEITALEPSENRVLTEQGAYEYDWLVIALGADIAPSEIPGLEEGYGKNAFYFYTMPSALALQKALENFDQGKLVLNVAEYPIKCPVAPIEFANLAHYFLLRKGIRDKVQLEVVTSQQSIFTKPICSDMMSFMLKQREIAVTPNFNVAEVDTVKGNISSYEGGKVSFDLLVSIPPNVGPGILDEARISDGNGYVRVNPNTLKSTAHGNIYALGDCTNVHTSKAGSVAHFEAGVVARNLIREIRGKAPEPDFDGHSTCFIETGFDKAYLIDFNYVQQPVPGDLPIPYLGPFSLLKDTRINHLGKLAFRSYYWNLLLKDRMSSLLEPFLPTRMSYLGKDRRFITPQVST